MKWSDTVEVKPVQFRIFDFELFPECGFVHSSNVKILNLKNWTIGRIRIRGTIRNQIFEIRRSRLTTILTLILFSFLGTAPLFSQTAASSISVSATKPSFIFGEPIKLTARVKDGFGNLLPQAVVNWTVDPPAAATIAADGTVTPRQLQTVVFRALSGNAQGEIAIQLLPKRIVVTPQRSTMIVGSTQVVRAEAMDIDDRPIIGTAFRWTMTNLARFWDNNNPMATIDGAGQMRALVQGKIWITASIEYDASSGARKDLDYCQYRVRLQSTGVGEPSAGRNSSGYACAPHLQLQPRFCGRTDPGDEPLISACFTAHANRNGWFHVCGLTGWHGARFVEMAGWRPADIAC
jgi:hypothetical protein